MILWGELRGWAEDNAGSRVKELMAVERGEDRLTREVSHGYDIERLVCEETIAQNRYCANSTALVGIMNAIPTPSIAGWDSTSGTAAAPPRGVGMAKGEM